MASTATRSRLFAATAGRAYRLEMEGRTLLLLLGLLTLTGVVVFYLGVVTGMGLRDPNSSGMAVIPQGGQDGLPAGVQEQMSDEELAFFRSLTREEPAVEGLSTEQAKISSQAEGLLSRAREEMAMEEVTPAPGVKAPTPARQATPPKAPTAAAPVMNASSPAAASAAGSYTVQVFSSQNQQRAQELVTRLKGQGFPAYLHLFQSADRETWYRVRVGKTSKPEADQLSTRLKRDAKLSNTQVLGL